MKTNRTKKIFLDHLRKIPIIQIACEKAVVARATVYRWKKESETFEKDMAEALTEGEALINDMSESQLISLIRDKNYPAISFWLRHRHQKFRDRVEVTANIRSASDELTPEQETIVREALQLSSINQVPTQSNESQKDNNRGASGCDDQGSESPSGHH
jgi:predicted DNA binding protein